MEKTKQPEHSNEKGIINRIITWLVYLDDIILILVALSIIGVAVLLAIEAVSDFIYYTAH